MLRNWQKRSKWNTKEKADLHTYMPSKIDCIMKAVLCLAIFVIPCFNRLEIERNEHLRVVLYGIIVLFLFLTIKLLLRMINRLTISNSGIHFEGRTGLFLLFKKIVFTWEDFDYCRTRKFYWHYSYFLLLDFFDSEGKKIKTIRIDYFDENDIIYELTRRGKFNQEKCIVPGVVNVSKRFLIIFFSIVAFFVVLGVILYFLNN